MPIRWGRKKTALTVVGGAMLILVIILILTAMNLHFRQKYPLYQTRKSICEPMLIEGHPIPPHQTDTGIARTRDHEDVSNKYVILELTLIQELKGQRYEESAEQAVQDRKV